MHAFCTPSAERTSSSKAARARSPRATSEGADWGALSASGDQVRALALDGLTRRLRITGTPLEAL